MPVERCIDHIVAGCSRFVGRRLVLARDVLNLEPSINLPPRAGQPGEHPEGRNFGSVAKSLDPRANGVGYQLAAPIDAQGPSELHVALEFEAVIFRLALAIFVDWQTVLDLAGRRLKNEVGIAAVIDASLEVNRPCCPVDAELGAVASFKLEAGIANEELLAPAMRTE